MSETLEKVAKAIVREHFRESCLGASLDDMCALPLRDWELRAARAAVAALADNISAEMIVEMSSADDCAYSAPHETNYRAMFIAAIRAALTKSQPL